MNKFLITIILILCAILAFKPNQELRGCDPVPKDVQQSFQSGCFFMLNIVALEPMFNQEQYDLLRWFFKNGCYLGEKM